MPNTLQIKLFSLCTQCPYSILHVVQGYRKTSFTTLFTKIRGSQIWTSGRPKSRHSRGNPYHRSGNCLFKNIPHCWCVVVMLCWKTYSFSSRGSDINHTCNMLLQVTRFNFCHDTATNEVHNYPHGIRPKKKTFWIDFHNGVRLILVCPLLFYQYIRENQMKTLKVYIYIHINI